MIRKRRLGRVTSSTCHEAEDSLTGKIYSRVENLDCLNLYGSPFGNRSDVILVSSYAPGNGNSLLHGGITGDADVRVGTWMCESSNTFSCRKLASYGFKSRSQREAAIAHWNVIAYPVSHCMVSYQPTEKLCQIVYSFRIMIGKCVPYIRYSNT